MHRQLLFIALTLLPGITVFSQQHLIKGRITNDKMEPLALVSVQVKDLRSGTVTNIEGDYELTLEHGSYTLVFTMMGFRSQVIEVVVNRNVALNVVMENAAPADLSEVVVRGKIKDRAEDYIRQVIQHKEEIISAAGSYSCLVYIKATQEDSGYRKKRSKKAILADTLPNRDLHRMAMAEISLRYDHGNTRSQKEERLGVVKRGNPESLFYLSVTEADFNLYNNLLQSRTLSTVPFLSPVSYSGMAAYKYKTIATANVGRRKLYTIAVRPRQLSNVTIEGELVIEDSTWIIRSAKFTLPAYHVPEYDLVTVEQEYSLIDGKAWMISRQRFQYFAKHGKAKLSGTTTASYTGFEFNKRYPPKYFGNEVSVTTEDAYQRDSLFWEKSRTEPLSPKEIRFIRYRDSTHRVTHSQAYFDSIDKKTNTITWKKITFSGQSFYNRARERSWHLPPVVTLIQPFTFGGMRIMPVVHYQKVQKSRKNISIAANLSYGFRNKDLNGNVRLFRMYNPFNRGFYRLEVKRDFQYIFSGDAWINMIKRNNVYLDNSVGIGHGLELRNGLFLETGVEMAFRRSVSNYKTNDAVDSLFGDILEDNRAVAFSPYNALYGRVALRFTPGQRYIREPKEKIILGSRWPTFYAELRKGIDGVFSSTIDFTYFETGINQELKLGIAGVSRYHILSGKFLSRRDLRLVDYKFQRRGDPLLFLNPNEAFQSLDSTFPVFKRFYQGHWVHEFNGAILNKIPLFKKLQLREVAGAGFLIAPERKLRYGELFTGVERVFRVPFNPLIRFKLGVYVVGSASNQFRNPVQFKIGITSWDRLRNRWF